MKPIDAIRYFGLFILFAAIDLLGIWMGWKERSGISVDRESLSAALITIIWAVRDGQRGARS